MSPLVNDSGIPLIDFGPYYSGSPADKISVGKQLVDAMRNVGFLYIINHGVPCGLMAEAFTWSKRFFELPFEVKLNCSHPPSGQHHRGWSSLGKEKVVQMVFDQEELARLRKIPDVKELFDLGNENNKVFYNIWPEELAIPGFKQFCSHYFEINTRVSKHILRALALGMDLQEDFFVDYHTESDNQVRLLHYPPTDVEALRDGKAERIAAHTDFGTMTMLSQDECGGLEVEDPFHKGTFIPAPYIKDSLVVNIGDFLMRWSNDALKSTLHRVRAPPVSPETGLTKVRYSIPFFISADKERTIDCLPGTFDENNPKKYEPINALEYLNKRLNATY